MAARLGLYELLPVMNQSTILIIGSLGQLGTELTTALQPAFPERRILSADLPPAAPGQSDYISLDVLDQKALEAVVCDQQVEEVYLLAALLSAKGEQNPTLAWQVNMDGLLNVLELARRGLVNKVFWPSSIAVFGSTTPKVNTPQETITSPETMYGITKLAGERLCAYYARQHGVDVRSLRYPGLVGYRAMPGGGTTDFAVAIYHAAVAGEPYTCFLRADTQLPLMYMPDAVEATLNLMQAPPNQVRVRSSYNLAGFSCTPAEIATTIQQHRPDFAVHYAPDFRQDIANAWPHVINDQAARQDWGWRSQYDLAAMTKDMLFHLDR